MAKKKDFSGMMNNPARHFMTIPEEEQAEEQKPRDKKPKRVPQVEVPEGYRLVEEKRTKRMQIVLQQSVYDLAKAEQERAGISFNELIHEALKMRCKK